MKKQLLVLIFLIVTVYLSAHDEQRNRGFYFAVGGGPANISYGEPLDSTLETFEALPGVDRISINVDFTIGGALTPKLFLVGNASGFGDSFYEEDYSLSFSCN